MTLEADTHASMDAGGGEGRLKLSQSMRTGDRPLAIVSVRAQRQAGKRGFFIRALRLKMTIKRSSLAGGLAAT